MMCSSLQPGAIALSGECLFDHSKAQLLVL